MTYIMGEDGVTLCKELYSVGEFLALQFRAAQSVVNGFGSPCSPPFTVPPDPSTHVFTLSHEVSSLTLIAAWFTEDSGGTWEVVSSGISVGSGVPDVVGASLGIYGNWSSLVNFNNIRYTKVPAAEAEPRVKVPLSAFPATPKFREGTIVTLQASAAGFTTGPVCFPSGVEIGTYGPDTPTGTEIPLEFDELTVTRAGKQYKVVGVYGGEVYQPFNVGGIFVLMKQVSEEAE